MKSKLQQQVFSKIIWALFGNDEDSVIGDKSFNPEQKDTILIRILWWIRNPLHNLMFHVPPFGFVGKDFIRNGNVGVFKEPEGGFGYAVLWYKHIPFPFISYYGQIKFYLGWRERGNFGIKLTWNSSWRK